MSAAYARIPDAHDELEDSVSELPSMLASTSSLPNAHSSSAFTTDSRRPRLRSSLSTDGQPAPANTEDRKRPFLDIKALEASFQRWLAKKREHCSSTYIPTPAQ